LSKHTLCVSVVMCRADVWSVAAVTAPDTYLFSWSVLDDFVSQLT